MTATEVHVRVAEDRGANQQGANQQLVLHATGEVDATNAAEFAQSVRSLVGAREAVLDISELDYLGSAGYAALDDLIASCGIRIVLAERSHLRRAAELMSLPFCDSVQAALNS